MVSWNNLEINEKQFRCICCVQLNILIVHKMILINTVETVKKLKDT